MDCFHSISNIPNDVQDFENSNKTFERLNSPDTYPTQKNSNKFQEELSDNELYPDISNKLISPSRYLSQKNNFNERIMRITEHSPHVKNTLLSPWKFICKLITLRTHGGTREDYTEATGFFVSPRCVLTCAHALYDRGWVDKVEVIPGLISEGRNKNILPYGKMAAERFRILKGYRDDAMRAHFDVGAIILEDDSLFRRIGGYMNVDASLEEPSMISCAGY
ncbi:MAG: trypsin-like serine peptidase, partial [Saprospiraceae bacterium]